MRWLRAVLSRFHLEGVRAPLTAAGNDDDVIAAAASNTNQGWGAGNPDYVADDIGDEGSTTSADHMHPYQSAPSPTDNAGGWLAWEGDDGAEDVRGDLSNTTATQIIQPTPPSVDDWNNVGGWSDADDNYTEDTQINQTTPLFMGDDELI